MTSLPPLLLLLLLLLLSTTFPISLAAAQEENGGGGGYISAVISDKGLAFAKDLLVEKAVGTLDQLRLPDIEKSVRFPFVGGVRMVASNITLSGVNVSSSTVRPGDSGVVIVASGATANLSMNWLYSYSTWLLPFEISDKGRAFVEVEGMEVGLTMKMENRNGSLELTVVQCGCYLTDLFITLDGGASWFYQGFINAFGDEIRAAVENTITKKIIEGALKLDSLLQTVPKKIDVDEVAALNVTFVNDPLLGNSSVEFDINGLFISTDEVAASSYVHKALEYDACDETGKMLWISLDEAVFNSLSNVYFEAEKMHWIVDKVPDQSLLNTAKYKFIIPELYRRYPNDDMLLNLSLTSPPVIQIKSQSIGASIHVDMTAVVLDGNEVIPVVCIAMKVSVLGAVRISGNYLSGQASLDDFNLSLKWSHVGNFHMFLIQGLVRVFLDTVFVPHVNTRLKQGFPLPIIRGFTLHNALIQTTSSMMAICSDVQFTNSTGITHSLL